MIEADLDAGVVPDIARLRDRFKPDATAIPQITVELTPLSAYDELCGPAAALLEDGLAVVTQLGALEVAA